MAPKAMFVGELTSRTLQTVFEERQRQARKIDAGEIPYDCADPALVPGIKASVLGEEYGELCKAVNEFEGAQIYVEAIHVAAVAVAIAESLTPYDSAGRQYGTDR